MRLSILPSLCFFATYCLVAACSADNSIDTTYDPCSSLTVVPGPDTGEVEAQSIADAITYWSKVLPTQIEVGTSTGEDPELPISFESGDNFYRALYLDGRGEILISRDLLAPEDLPLAIAHEMGHAFGLFHVSKDLRASVMNQGNLEVGPSDEDANNVSDLWEHCR